MSVALDAIFAFQGSCIKSKQGNCAHGWVTAEPGVLQLEGVKKAGKAGNFGIR